jgi:drug/metabolite transporter (DMT)-like permease
MLVLITGEAESLCDRRHKSSLLEPSAAEAEICVGHHSGPCRQHLGCLHSSEWGQAMSAVGLDLTAVGGRRLLDWKQVKQDFSSSWFAAQSSLLPIFAAACLTIVLFALTPATTRLAAVQIDGLSVGIIRTVGAGLVALPLLILLRLAPPKKAADWTLLLCSAFGSFAAFPVLFSIGTQRTSGCHAALIMAVMPLLVGGAGMVLDRRLPRLGWFMGASIAVAGEIALVGIRGGSSATATLSGDAIVLAGCVLFALGVVAGARLSSRINPLSATFWAITVASIGLSPLAVTHWQTMPISYHAFTATTWAAVIHITLGATIIANVSWLWALSRGGLVRVAPIQFAQPVCALFFASALLGERLTGGLVLVAAVIIFGTVTACRGARPPSKRGATP